MTDKAHNILTWLASIIFFVIAYVAVMNGYDVLMFDLVMIGGGLFFGLSVGTFVRRRRERR